MIKRQETWIADIQSQNICSIPIGRRILHRQGNRITCFQWPLRNKLI